MKKILFVASVTRHIKTFHLPYLKYFKDITDESSIPCNSLIREFIGGSCFKV